MIDATISKHEKLLAIAATRYGAPIGVYATEADELIRAGKLVRREVFCAGGRRDLRLFLAEVAV